MISDADLLAIEERAKAATPGPWLNEPLDDDPDLSNGIWGPGHRAIVKTDSGVYPPERDDAEFIAHAREDVPALIAEVKRLREWIRGHWTETRQDQESCLGCGYDLPRVSDFDPKSARNTHGADCFIAELFR